MEDILQMGWKTFNTLIVVQCAYNFNPGFSFSIIVISHNFLSEYVHNLG